MRLATMKVSLERDFTVSVRHQIWEELPEKSEYYRGIYSVNLNFLVSVMFVPGFEINEEEWPPVLPENLDEVSSENEARLFTTALSDYTVTPQTRWAGKAEKILLPSGKEDRENSDINLQTGVVFYVSNREFEVFSQELSALAQQTPGAHDSVKISEIKELEISKFLLDKIVDSPHFSTQDLKILRREDKYPHTPVVGETKPQSERVA